MKYGEKYNIHGYKHNGNIYKTWDEAILLDQTDEYYVFGNNRTKVTKEDGKSWRTREAAVMFFYKKSWFNIIAQLKSNGIYYYCNIASPVVIENNTIKYIDYDLDLRIFPDGAYKILDESEYEYHKNLMHYSKDLDMIIKYELEKLIDKYLKKEKPFNINTIKYYNNIYNNYIKEKN